jgi:molecular chaperone GrpE
MNDEMPLNESERRAESPMSAAPEDRDELAELKDRHLRLAADFENYKRRVREDTDRTVTRQKDSLVKDLLSVLDNLNRALEFATDDASPIRAGVELTLQQFRQVLRQHGYEPDACVGQTFDPRRQESIGSRCHPSSADHAVLEVVQEGWLRKGQLVRPAKVIINDLANTPESRSSRMAESDDESVSNPNETK